MKKRLLMIGRVLVAFAALYFATRKIDWQELKQVEWGYSFLWLIPALVSYNISQCISAYRLLQYYHLHQPEIRYAYNLRLYYKGMFYNLFLPGGIGGDAYKIIALKTNTNTYRQLTTATLMDRVTGLGVLVLIITVLSMMVPPATPFKSFFEVLPILVITGLPAYYIIVFYFFRPFHRVLPLAAIISIFVQAFQLLSFICILWALQIEIFFFPEMAFLFFTSSVIAALPLSIGGIGTRELAIATGAGFFGYSATKMVSASLLFFLLVVLSSLVGWMVSGMRQSKMSA